MKKKVSGSCDSRDETIGSTEGIAEPFACFTDSFYDKTEITVKSTALVPSPMHAIVLSLSHLNKWGSHPSVLQVY